MVWTVCHHCNGFVCFYSKLLIVPAPVGKDVTGSSLTWAKLRELQKKTHCMSVLFSSLVLLLSSRTDTHVLLLSFSPTVDQVELEALYEQFKSLSTVEEGEGGIDKETFEQCLGPLGLEKNLITERIFSFFDQDGNGVIDFAELVCGLSILCKGNLDEKIKCELCFIRGEWGRARFGIWERIYMEWTDK